ncbi:MAG: hypothetical protein JWQ89_2257 [Devosia sp.]|uniref:hypothetical protein n=1 Tax=Devosia sp. TaxID=1871048 RepID=UPI002610DE3A|nr:hypothetical protein [Devosia sp.]MDB5540530.1 hypothetical protein [Devosia sp.]
MRLTVTTQPEPLVTLDEAKTALGESGSDRDELIEGLILAAQSELDGPKGWVGISVAQQTVEVRFDRFCNAMQLPAGPVIAPVTLTYLDDDGAEQTLDSDVYALLSDGRLVLVPDQSWPSTYSRAEAVTAAYQVGIEDADDPRIALMKTAIILHVKMTLDHEEPEKRRETINWLVSSLKVWSV